MAGESLSFDIVGHDRASGSFRAAAAAASDMGGKMDLAAKASYLLDESLKKSRKATDASAGAALALAKADKILADAEHVLRDGALEAEFALKKQAKAAAEAGAASAAAGGGGGIGAMVTPMTGIAAAAAALAPVLITSGIGLAGLGIAAAGTLSPLLKAAQASGGLSANMKKLDPEQQAAGRSLLALQGTYRGFEKALAPQVLGDFSAAVRVAGTLLHNLQPVSRAAGIALGGVLRSVDAELRSNNFRNFFTFMAQTAGPDIKLLGNAFVSLTGTLPTLLEALQPVATSLLTIVDYTGQAIRLSELASTNFSGLGKAAQKSGDGFNATTEGAKAAIPGLRAVSNFAHTLGQGLGVLYGNSKPAAAGLKDTGAKAAVAGAKLQTMAQAVTALTTAESKSLDTQLAYSGALITAKNDSVSLRTALKASAGAIGLHTAAQRASFSAANTYIGDLEQVAQKSWASGKGTDGAIRAIRDGLPILDSAKTKNKNYWQEVRTLTDWLHKLEKIKPIRDVVKLSGSGAWTFGLSGTGSFPSRHIKGRAAGWRVPGYGGGDRHPALLEAGEAVVPKTLVPAIAPFLSANKVPGFASGGLVPSYSGHVAGLKPWGQSNFNATLLAMTQAFVNVGKAQQSLGGITSGALGGDQAANQRLARQLFPWSASQWPSYVALEMREAGFNRFARNPSSGAYGIPQALPPTKMPFAAQAAGGSHAGPQLGWQFGYIGQRYGTPAAAWGHEQAAGWYGNGLDAIFRKPTLIGVGERGPEQVHVGRPGSGTVKVELVVRTGHGASDLDRAIVAIIQKHVSVNGGDTQVALGEKY